MSKYYVAREIRNLHDLHLEQLRVRHALKNLKSNFTGSFTSSETIFSILSYLLFRRNKKKKARLSDGPHSSNSIKRDKATTLANSEFAPTITPRKNQKSYKKLGRTILIWETAALLAFVGGTVARHYYKKRRNKK